MRDLLNRWRARDVTVYAFVAQAYADAAIGALGLDGASDVIADLVKHHRERPDDKSHPGHCAQCYWPWPCPNVCAAALLAATAPQAPAEQPGRETEQWAVEVNGVINIYEDEAAARMQLDRLGEQANGTSINRVIRRRVGEWEQA